MNGVLPGVAIDNLLHARECLCLPREAQCSPTGVGDDGLASSELLLGVVLGLLLCWEYGHQTFSMHGYVEDGFRRG